MKRKKKDKKPKKPKKKMPELIPYKNRWLCSYETLRFDTSDGDIDIGQYALINKGYYIRTKSKDEGQFDRVDSDYKVAGLKKVKLVVGEHCYYDEFRGADGKTIRIQSTGKKYWDTARIKNHPQPERVEMVEEIPVFSEDELSPPPEHHSIGLDATSNSGLKSSVSSYSWAHECTGDDGLLVVGNSYEHSGIGTTIKTITFNGDALTLVRLDNAVGVYPKYNSALYYRIAPDTGGAYTVAVTLFTTIVHAAGGAISYTGADQENQPDANNGNAGNDGTPTVDVTTIADNSWVVSVIAIQAATAISSDNTERWDVISNNGGFGGSDTDGPKTPAGDQTMSWTSTSGNNWAISTASFAPAVSVEGAAGIMTTNTGYWGATF